MNFRPNELISKMSRRQWILLVALAGALLVGFSLFAPDPVVIGNNASGPQSTEIERVVMDMTRGARAERSWLDLSEGKIRDIESRLEVVESDRRRLVTANEELLRENRALAETARKAAENATTALDAQAAEIDRLRAAQEVPFTTGQQPTTPTDSERTTGGPGYLPPPVADSPFTGESPFRRGGATATPVQAETAGSPTDGAAPVQPTARVRMIHFDLGARSRSLTDYLPAGSYAPAVVVSGVDAGVGVESQSDPRPVLFRITGPAVSAAHEGNRQTVDLAGCLVTGAAIGDLSSEKVYVRLQRMTCSRRASEVYEANVAGYMTGAGKAGVRGLVVSREGDLVTRSFLAGMVSGVGEGLAQTTQPGLATVGNVTTQQALGLEDIARSGLGKGVASAGERIADYLIKRAEQYQPIVVMQSGTAVELVFIEGVALRPGGGPQTSAGGEGGDHAS